VAPCDGEILIFEVGGRRYGLPASDVRELVRAVAIVPLPLAGPGVEGVVNLRGQVIPVIDLRARLGLPARAVAPSDHMIVAESEGRLVALRVDRALDLVRLDADTVAAGVGETEETRVARLPDGLAPLLDVRGVLAIERPS
jgi:purine-binding chemotaxis protein CheW